MNDLEKEGIISDYLNGFSMTDLCKKYHHKFYKIKEILDSENIPRINKGRKRKTLSEEQKTLIRKLYCEEKRGQLYCSKQLGITIATLKKFLKEEKIGIRNFSDAAVATNQNRTKYKNEFYFDNESPSMAWVLGFLASDGSVSKDRNTIKISLSIKDKEILEKIKKEIEIENEIKEYVTKEGFEYCSLQWTCERHKKKLAEYNIIPQKTFLLKPPLKLKKEYWIDYIRGYFDGDGSINYLKNNGALRWQICSATKEILIFIVDFLFAEYQIPRVSILEQKRANTPLYYIQYSTNSTKMIYKILYTPNSLFLKRKKENFDNIMK